MKKSQDVYIGADFYKSYASIVDHLSEKAVPISIPIGIENEFKGIIDLVKFKCQIHMDDEGKVIETTDIPEDMLANATEYRNKLIEVAADVDDDIAMKYLEGQEITGDELEAAVRKGVLLSKIFPVMAGSSLRNKGVQEMLDNVCRYLPSPNDKYFAKEDPTTHEEKIYTDEIPGTDPHTGEVITRHLNENDPFSGLVFKLAVDPHVGNLAFFRVYSGKLQAGSYVYNSTTGNKERVGRILMMHANHREEVKEVKSGDIAAIVGFKDTKTGNTICDDSKPILLEGINFAEPVVKFAIEPKTKSDQEKLSEALGKLVSEDPTFKAETDRETGQVIIAGMGELHLDIKVDILKREYGIEVTVGKPQVAYRETINAKGEHRELLKKQSGGAGQYADIAFVLQPLERGVGYKFVDSIKGGAIPREYISSIDKGIQESITAGPLGGYPVVDIQAEIVDGSYHEVDSNTDTFRTCAYYGFKNAMKVCSPVLLEPIMTVTINVPEDYVGACTGYLSSKRGLIKNLLQRGKTKEIIAEAPLSELFGYVSDLRNLTSGTAAPNMEPSHYAEVPKNIMEKILTEAAK